MGIDKNLIQGSLNIMLLRLLEDKDMYGYEMIETLRKKSDNVFELKAGSLYPLLHSLEEKEFLTSYQDDSSGKKRKYYHLTASGRKQVKEKKREWETYQTAVTNVLHFSGGAL
ncbi:MAG: PadR family transcriptional regulator [Lachnospiraceae bacterium]|jgi:Predicted transcriptional regulators|uniref:PadR family transcriptional regulator n=1 Tax=Roseburia sp. 1XD42-69 TaxID=2320088 RepID=UPI000EA048C6|nr:PadR family transcriptional regulator [Roseburia sp. 1XD42-69]MCI8875729.1 PadR family transcriptional regulator [Lachnospiraceae bacterium]MCX4318912.1 PadR family transcriptional regulator [Lachnospiraceae bacterium]RKJ63798.1 PadR family transcriptional regulator [Roseburia sp. 1XD42-69]